VTGTPGQVVCGLDLRNYQCGPGGFYTTGQPCSCTNPVSAACTVTVTATTPTVNSVTISSPIVVANNSNQYTITITGSDTAGAANITHEYVLINYQCATGEVPCNAGQYRGFIGMYYPGASNPWPTEKNPTNCTGGGYAAIFQNGVNSVYGHQNLNLVSCNVSSAGNNRITSFVVRFDPVFTAPITLNDISGYVHNAAGNNTGWVNSNINFSLAVPPVLTNATINPNPVNANGANNHNIVVTATDVGGGATIGDQYALINYQGANQGAHRGYVGWSNQGFTAFGGTTGLIACTGGGSAAKSASPGFGDQYIQLISCSTVVAGNTRTTTFVVRFNSNFTTPSTNNTISAWANDTTGASDGWEPFGTFSLVANPTISNVVVVEPNYCSSGPGATITWTITSNGPQTNYRIQIDDTAGFPSPVHDTGVVNSGSSTYAVPLGVLQLNSTYQARVIIGNAAGGSSGWVNMNACVGPGCNGNSSWDTPVYTYPQIGFTYSPANPARGVPVTFTDTTVFGNPASPRQWTWNWGDGTPNTVINGMPPGTGSTTHTYANAGSFSVSLTAIDASGQNCASNPPQIITPQRPIPIWKEVLPR
jgi:hypothetical protein